MLTDRSDRDRSTDRAVSPVIGVILMVAVTVILAATIGVFVMDLGQSTQQTTPQASFGFEYNSTNTSVTVVHEGGDTLNPDNTVAITIDATDDSTPWGLPISAGDTSPRVTVASGDTVRVVWESPEGKTQVLAEFNVP